MIGKSNATLPDEATDAAIDSEVTNLFLSLCLSRQKKLSKFIKVNALQLVERCIR
jgi:hypothetical protein